MGVRLSIGLVAVVLGTGIAAQERQVIQYDLKAMPMLELSANIDIKKVMGEVGTFTLAEFAPGFKSTPHHHTHEQVNIGIAESFEIVADGVPHPVAHLRGLIIPTDVMHGNDTLASKVSATQIEFQPVRRVDFPPEREKVTFPIGPSTLPTPDGWQVAVDFGDDSKDWERLPNGVRVNARKGKMVAVSAWKIPATARELFDLRLHVPGAEQFAYVLDGELEARNGTERFPMSAGILLVNRPNSKPLQVHAVGKTTATLLVFEAAAKSQ